MAHIGIVWAVVNRLLAAAAKIAKEQGDDAPEVLGLTMWALAFLWDQCTHLHIAGDETSERAADGNVMQRGHKMGIFPLTALASGGCVVMGEKIPLWCENIPDHGFDTLGARVILNKAFMGPVFAWTMLHASGAFGGETEEDEEDHVQKGKQEDLRRRGGVRERHRRRRQEDVLVQRSTLEFPRAGGVSPRLVSAHLASRHRTPSQSQYTVCNNIY